MVKAREKMGKVKAREEAKPVVAKEALPKGAVLCAGALIGHPNAYRTSLIKGSPIPIRPQVRADFLCFAR